MEDTLMPKVIRRLLSTRGLEILIERLDKRFDGLNLKNLPEYEVVVNAMNAYAEAAVLRYEQGLEEQRRLFIEGTGTGESPVI